MEISSLVLDNVLDGGINAVFTTAVLEIRTGARPATVDSASTGNLIASLSLPATPFGAASGNQVPLAGSWAGTCQSSGTAGWFRIRNASDPNTASSAYPRIDGSVGVDADAPDLAFTSAVFALNDTVTITGFYIELNRAAFMVASAGTVA